MKSLLFACIVFLSLPSFSQEKISTTNSFSIEGKIKSNSSFSIHSLDSFTSKFLGDITTVNHKGEVMSVRKNVKAVLLEDILAKTLLEVAKPKELNSYYLVLIGSDGYKFVLSYSEVFNNNNIYVVTESNGKKGSEIEDRIAILILAENNKGHIAMKGLKTVMVEKAM